MTEDPIFWDHRYIKPETAIALGRRRADPKKNREYAKGIIKGLIWFAILRSTDEKKAKALARLDELRLEIQEILDVIAPGWGEV